MTQADDIRPYALGVKYKILRDVQEAVPYAVILYYNLLEKFQFFQLICQFYPIYPSFSAPLL